MPIGFVLDENLRGPLWHAIERHNLHSALLLDVVRVGDSSELPLASDDVSILRWAERSNRILVSLDKRSMFRNLAVHLEAGHRSPGVIILREGASISDILEIMVLISYAGNPADFVDQIGFLP